MSGYEVRVEERAGRPAAVIRADVPYEDLATFLSGAFAEVMGAVAEQGASLAGPPFGRYTPDERGFGVTAGFPVDRPVLARGRVVPDELRRAPWPSPSTPARTAMSARRTGLSCSGYPRTA